MRGIFFGRRRRERELDEELRSHLDMETERNRQAGMSEAEARAAAHARFGSVAEVKDEVRDSWGARFLDELRADVRVGLRGLWRDRGFSLVVMLTLALGIGANTAIFSVVNGILLRPLPYTEGDRLVRVQQQLPRASVTNRGFSPLEIVDLRDQSKTLEGVAEYHTMWFHLLGHGEPLRVQTGVVSANFFDVLGVRPILGRNFVPGEDRDGAQPVLILSYAFWKNAFHGDPSVIGQTFEMNDKPHVVIGVLPPIPIYPDENDLFMPTSACPFRSAQTTVTNRNARISTVFSRLAPAATVAAARAELAGLAERMRAAHPADYTNQASMTFNAVPIREEITQGWRVRLLLLLGVAACMLLIVCANVANLTLARGMRREHEMAVRAALGAGRRRLLRQLLTEGMILAVLGAGLGLAMAAWSHDLLVDFMARRSARVSEIRIDTAVLLFTLGLAILTGLVFAIVPALPGRRDVASAMKEDGNRTGAGLGRRRLRSALVVVQVAFSFTLLVGAGLALRSLSRLEKVDPGFTTENVLTMTVDLDWARYRGQQNQEARIAAYDRLLERVREAPGISSAAIATTIPLNQTANPFSGQFEIEARSAADREARPRADIHLASPAFFATIGLPLSAGRAFTDGDTLESTQVAIINRSLATHQFAGEEPVGRRISFDQGQTWNTIVGVVADARVRGLDQPPADEIYLPVRQTSPLSASLLVRTSLEPHAAAGQIRDLIYSVDPRQPVAQVKTLDEVRALSLANPRSTTALLALIAVLAVIVTAAGLGGVLAVTVSQRAREIAVRMALGARRGDVVALVLRQGMTLVLLGLALGAAGAFGLGKVMASFLFEVAPTDPLTFAGVAIVLVGVATLACLLPARRAASIDPMNALRAGA